MKRKQLLIANILGVILILFVAVTGKISYTAFIKSLSSSMNEASATGIIGGADGSTAIFISGGFNLNTILLLLIAALVLTAVIFVWNIIYLKNGGKNHR